MNWYIIFRETLGSLAMWRRVRVAEICLQNIQEASQSMGDWLTGQWGVPQTICSITPNTLFEQVENKMKDSTFSQSLTRVICSNCWKQLSGRIPHENHKTYNFYSFLVQTYCAKNNINNEEQRHTRNKIYKGNYETSGKNYYFPFFLSCSLF